MILTVNGQNITELVEQVRVSDNTKQASRRLEFSAVHDAFDRNLPTAALPLGAVVLFAAGDTYNPESPDSFMGLVWTLDKGTTEKKATVHVRDLMHYFMQSQMNRAFSGTPEQIAQVLCAELGVPFGSAAATGIETYFLAKQKTAYQTLMMAYTVASKQNGKKYIPVMKGNALHVIEQGAQLAGVILDSDYNITDANHNQTLDDLVNQVQIVNTEGAVVDQVEDANSRARFGTIRKTVQQQDGIDAKAQARVLIKGISQRIQLKGPDIPACRAGTAVTIKESITGLYGRFFISSSTHTYKDGAAPEMELTVSFKNLMDMQKLEP